MSRPTLAVLDPGTGNLASVLAALEAAGARPLRTADPADLARADGIVLPGVGHFAAAMARLEGLRPALRAAVDRGTPLLGICLGMQLLFAWSEEGEAPGLGLLPGRVCALAGRADPERVPHMGWTPVGRTAPSPLFAGIEDGTPFYFAHSFAAYPDGPAPWVVGVARARRPFPAAVSCGPVHGVQFHPERSGRAGLALLRNFVALCRARAEGAGPGQAAAAGRLEPFLAIPALDLAGGRCVRWEQGDPAREQVVGDDPVAVARAWVAAGAARLHVVDLDGALRGEPVHLEAIRAICALGVPVQAGGGVRSPEAARALRAAGVERVIVGTAAAEDPGLLAELARVLGPHLTVSLDLRRDPEGGWRLASRGWRRMGAPLPEALARLRELGVTEVVVSDVERDGTLAGVRPDAFLAVARHGLRVLAAGGVASLADLDALAALPGVAGAVVGRAAYSGGTRPVQLFGWRPAWIAGEPAPAAAAAPAPTGPAAQAPAAPVAPAPSSPAVPAPTAPAAAATAPDAPAPDHGPPVPPGPLPRVVPCLDVKGGRVVKGVRFLDLRELGDPVALARRYAAEGADEIVLLDIAATPEGRSTLLALVRAVAEQVFVPLTVGGGIRDVEDARQVLLAGADKVAVNTAAVDDPDLIGRLSRRFGRQATVLAVDVRRTRDPACPSGWEVVTHAGQRPRGIDALAWCEEAEVRGAGEILVTSVDRDGTREGYDLELLAALRRRVRVPIIASGGAGSPEHLAEALAAGADAVLLASLLHEGEWTVGGIKAYLRRRGVTVHA